MDYETQKTRLLRARMVLEQTPFEAIEPDYTDGSEASFGCLICKNSWFRDHGLRLSTFPLARHPVPVSIAQEGAEYGRTVLSDFFGITVAEADSLFEPSEQQSPSRSPELHEELRLKLERLIEDYV